MTQTDDLIQRLSRQAAIAPLRPAKLGVAMGLSVLVPVALFLLIFGTRPGLGEAWTNPVVPLKTLLPLTVFALSLALVLRLIRPEARVGAAGWGYGLPLAGAIALWIGAFAMRAPQARFADVNAFSLEECLGSILMLSVVPVLVMLRMLRIGATSTPLLTGALAGLCAASGVAAGYSLFCTRDNPLFFVTWYGVAILIVTAISALVGNRALRW